MKKYNHQDIEKKWQERWENEQPYKAQEGASQKKYYLLVEFPYPSGDGLHVGHVRSYTALDIIARKKRAEGFNVLYPIGWDAFGLPTENYAVKTGIHPKVVTKQNTDNFRRQLKAMGFSFDWSREINTTDPTYYKWTQWIFLQFFKKGLAYKAKMPINWCLTCKIGLANEEVIEGRCERCGGPTEKREKEQWMMAITKYADRLLQDLEAVDYWEKIKAQQRNWIGRSEGAEIDFPIKGLNEQITVFTTRADTLFGATFMVLAPEHPLILKFKDAIENWKEVTVYIKAAAKKTEIDRTAEGKEKTGIELKGIKAINPANGEEIPIYVADYVLSTYGTGAIMAVPAHDERDGAFAKKYDIPIRHVIMPRRVDHKNPHQEGKELTHRTIIIGIVEDPKTKKFLALKWKKQPWTTFITGGVEEGEDPIEAARREITEETGYKNLTFVRVLGGPTRAEFFAAHKNVNRITKATLAFFALENHDQSEIAEVERDQHEAHWMTLSELKKIGMAHAESELIFERLETGNEFYAGEGILINSGAFDGLPSEQARGEIARTIDGRPKTTYKLRDWIFSRQRYWGEPIPIVYCEKDGYVAVPESELPVELPEVEAYKPTDSGESPLASIDEWVRTTCPTCGGSAKRETDTMPNWAGSSWYYLRYMDPRNDKAFAGKETLAYWSPVDWYNGGMEHTTLHLLYSRFWHKFLYDEGHVPTIEPYAKRTSHGLILAPDGSKMSKSKGNVVNPDSVIEEFGADTLRLGEMFMGPFDQSVQWSTNTLAGMRRFLERVVRLAEKVTDAKPTHDMEQIQHVSTKKVSEDIDSLKFNTAVSQLMIFLNALEAESSPARSTFSVFLRLLAPFAPHLTEELWTKQGATQSIHSESWPRYEEGKTRANSITLAISVNGKVRGTLTVPTGMTEEDAVAKARELPHVAKWLSGKREVKRVYVPDKLLNFVVAD